MARPLRIEYPGACYHVMNRGNQRQRVFHTDLDYERFVWKLGEFAKLYGVRVLAYCLMPNHFHLYLRTEQANLSRFMQGFLTSVTVSQNRRRRTSGHIFQGRFKAQVVEDKAYGAELPRYIHLNPVRVRRASGLSVQEKRKLLRGCRWSSYAETIGVRRSPEWLDVAGLLARLGRTPREQMRAYRRYVEEGLLRDVDNPLAAARAQSVLGTDRFVDWIKREFLLRESADRREQPELVHLQEDFSLEALAAAVGRAYDVTAQNVLRRRGPHREPRQVLMYLACRHGRQGGTLTALASRFGVTITGLTAGRDRLAARLPRDRALRRRVTAVEKALGLPGE